MGPPETSGDFVGQWDHHAETSRDHLRPEETMWDHQSPAETLHQRPVDCGTTILRLTYVVGPPETSRDSVGPPGTNRDSVIPKKTLKQRLCETIRDLCWSLVVPESLWWSQRVYMAVCSSIKFSNCARE